MLGYHEARVAERSRPNYTPELMEYARLEFPHEDPQSVTLLAIAVAKEKTRPVHRRFRFFRKAMPSPEAACAKA